MNDRLHNAFDKVRAEEELKKHTREFLLRKTNGYGKKRMFFSRRLAVAVSCLVLFLAGGTGYFTYLVPASVISLDVNPSIELGINRFDKVVSVEIYNDAGDSVMSGVNVYYMDYEKALERILTDKSMEQYTAAEQMIAVTVFGSNEEKSSEMLGRVSECTASYANVHCSAGNAKEAAKAHDLGLSYGKYKAFLELQALDPDVTAEEVKGLTMRQIRDWIRALSEEDGTTQREYKDGCEGENSGNGYRHRRGNGNGWGQN